MLNSINFTDPQILAHIKTIGYPTMLFLMILEGPVTTLVAALAASLGFFNVYLVFVLSMLGDIIGDIILYSIGWSGGAKALEKAEKILKIKPEIVTRVKNLFEHHGKKTIFTVKSTTGLCWITFIAAGTLRMRFKDFLTGSVLGGVVWSGFLVIMGYFFGYAFAAINSYIKYAGIIIFIAAATFYAILTIYKRWRSRQILEG